MLGRSLPAFPLDLWEEETACAYGRDSKTQGKTQALSPTTLLHPSVPFWIAFSKSATTMKKIIEGLPKGKPASNSIPYRHTPYHTGGYSESSLNAGNSGFPILVQVI